MVSGDLRDCRSWSRTHGAAGGGRGARGEYPAPAGAIEGSKPRCGDRLRKWLPRGVGLSQAKQMLEDAVHLEHSPFLSVMTQAPRASAVSLSRLLRLRLARDNRSACQRQSFWWPAIEPLGYGSVGAGSISQTTHLSCTCRGATDSHSSAPPVARMSLAERGGAAHADSA